MNRNSPFSVWGQTDLEWLQKAVRYAVVVLGLSLAFIPRRRSLPQIAALAAAVIIAIQLTADHWFYLYIVWFFPLLLAGMVAAEPEGTEAGGRDEGTEGASYGRLKLPVPGIRTNSINRSQTPRYRFL